MTLEDDTSLRAYDPFDLDTDVGVDDLIGQMELTDDTHAGIVPSAAWVRVSPERARQWLVRNSDNRSYRASGGESLAEAMRIGDFRVAGDPVRFDHNGTLIDGQHRLTAITQQEDDHILMVMWDFDPEVRRFIDQGLGRTVGDALGFAGIKHGGSKTGVARILYDWDRGRYAMSTQHHKGTAPKAVLQRWVLSNDEDFGPVRDSTGTVVGGSNPMGSCRVITSPYNSKVAPRSLIAAYLISRRVDPEKAAMFLDGVRDNTVDADLIAVTQTLRRTLRAIETDGKINTNIAPAAVIFTYLRAFELYREGKAATMSRFAYWNGGKGAPIPYGEYRCPEEWDFGPEAAPEAG